MKRLLLASLALTAPLAAQGPALGLLGGLTSSKVAISGGGASLTLDSRIGFAVGASLRHPLSQAFDLEIDALYAQKGFKLEVEDESGELKLGYLEVPVLLSYGIGYGSSLQPFLLGGVSVAFKAGCSVGGTSAGVSLDLDCDEVLGTDQESMDLGLTYGAGLRFERFSVQARYTMGMMTITHDEDDEVTSKNRTWYLLGGVSF
ncbi:MAG TPA: porin family protein [Gemmatimonadales bacterium]|nr:porin family protein [Gemmatimonadales bacterium]